MKLFILIFMIILLFFTFNIKAEINSSALWRSAIFSGWGQCYSGAKVKGYIFMGTGALLVGSSIFTYITQDNAYDHYKSASSDFNKKWDKYVDKLSLCQTVIGITCVFYIYNLIDAAFLTEDKNIVKNESSFQIKLYALNELKYDMSYSGRF